jgi:branched-chain amino acid transport system substrate-binding protein
MKLTNALLEPDWCPANFLPNFTQCGAAAEEHFYILMRFIYRLRRDQTFRRAVSTRVSLGAIIAVLVVAGVAGYVALSNPPATSRTTTSGQPPTGAPYKIGIMEDTTSSLAGWSAETIAMANVAVNQINAQGGVLGRPVQLITASEGTNALAAAQSLVLQSNVSAVVGVTYSGDAISIMPFQSSHHVLGIFGSDSLDNLMQNVTSDYNDFKYFFRVFATNTNLATDLQSLFASGTKPASVYYISENFQSGQAMYAGVNATAQKLGIKVLGASLVPFSQTDFSAIAAQIASLHPSAVIDGQIGSGASTFYTQLKANPAAAGIQVFYISQGALADPAVLNSILSSSPGSLNGLIITDYPGTYFKPYNDEGSALNAAYKNSTGTPFYSDPAGSYVGIKALALAIQNAKSFDPNSIIPKLEQLHYDSPIGLVTFDSSHNWVVPAFWYVQIQGGNQVIVWPSQYATGKLQ